MSVIPDPEQLYFENDGEIPNSPLPVLLYRSAFPERGDPGAEWLEESFARHGWTNSWRNGVYPYHHYHTNTHEVLGVYRGSALLHLGGESGAEVEVVAGDVIVLPAGAGHKRLGSTHDFAVVGAYPDGMDPETLKAGELTMEDALEQIRRVPLPQSDPVRGDEGWPGIWK
ncbi:cupin [Luteolibacter luteus]|uniref:Cupin n=1 Tax=Luteolibacter luteus TaxID=2728835 RepID=A0A858RF26_9BACT|nr:cupin [Luteolibacter luteus]QJE95029.1 cupin [Luteolibacter luteus]